MNIIHKTAILAIYQCICYILVQSNNPNCFSSLSNYINSKQKFYQAILIYERFKKNTILINKVSNIISSHVSTLQINYPISHEHLFYQLPSERVSRPMTLFVILCWHISFIEEIMKKLEELMWSMHDQKILIVTFNIMPKDILLYAWKRQFIDVTYFRIIKNITNKRLAFTGTLIENMTINQFNPFKNQYTENICNLENQWFPNKMTNLHGYPLRIGMIDDPPFCNIVRNLTGHVVKISGTEVEILNFLAEALNFRLNFIPWTGENIIGGRIEYTDKLYGYVRELAEGRIDFIANHIPRRLAMEKNTLFDHGRALRIDQYCAIVPIIPTTDFNRHQTILPIVGFILIVIVLIFAQISHFDEQFWTVINITYAILGFSLIKTPNRIPERIMFLILIGVSCIYSASLWNELMQYAMDIKTEVDFGEIEDIIKWPLALMSEQEATPMDGFLEFENDDLTINKVHVIPSFSDEKCMKMLIDYKNVSCIMGKMVGSMKIFEKNLYR